MLHTFLFAAVSAAAVMPKASAPTPMRLAGTAALPRAAAAASSVTPPRLAAPVQAPSISPLASLVAPSPLAPAVLVEAPASASGRALVQADAMARALMPAAKAERRIPLTFVMDVPAPPLASVRHFLRPITPEQAQFLRDSMTGSREKWAAAMARFGVPFQGSEPEFGITQINRLGRGARLQYGITWRKDASYGGTFIAVLDAKTGEPRSFRRGFLPRVPDRRATVRFAAGTTPVQARRFLRGHKLLKGAKLSMPLAEVTLKDEAYDLARDLQMDRRVLYVSPRTNTLDDYYMLDAQLANDAPGKADATLRALVKKGYVVLSRGVGQLYRLAPPLESPRSGAAEAWYLHRYDKGVIFAAPARRDVPAKAYQALVKFRVGLTDSEIREILRKGSLRVIDGTTSSGFLVAHNGLRPAAEYAKRVRRLPGVASVEEQE